jgi:hypothetical protein
MNVRRTIVKTSEMPMSGTSASIVTAPQVQPASTIVTRRVSRSYSSTPISAGSYISNAAYQVEAQPRVFQGEKAYYTAKPTSSFISSFPVPTAPFPITNTVAEVDASKATFLYPIQTIPLNESHLTNISMNEKVNNGLSTTYHRVVHAEAPTSNSYLDKDFSTTSSQLVGGKMEPTTQIRFVNHPITVPGVRLHPDGFGGYQSGSEANPNFQDTANVQLYRASGAPISRNAVSPKQG